jgi:hypothetical protein
MSVVLLIRKRGKVREVRVTGHSVGGWDVHRTYQPEPYQWPWTVSYQGYAAAECPSEGAALELAAALSQIWPEGNLRGPEGRKERGRLRTEILAWRERALARLARARPGEEGD